MKGIKQIIAVSILISILAVSSGCKKEAPLFLELSSVPSVTVNTSSEVVKRYFDYFNDTFTPSDEYGTLIPFVGDVTEYKSLKDGDNSVLSLAVYGLCTLDGTIVVDPVYDNVIKHELVGTTLYELLIGSPDAQFAQKRILISSDGRFMTELDNKQSVTDISGDECFAIARKGTIKRNKKKVEVTYYDFYSYDFNLLFTFDKSLCEAENTKFSIGNFSNGFAPVNVTVTTETVEKDNTGKEITVKTQEQYGFYIDNKGKNPFKKQQFSEVQEFSNGLAVVKNKDGLYGVIKTDGSYLFETEHKSLSYNAQEGYFAVSYAGYFLITDINGETLSKIYCENAEIEVIGTDSIIYKKTFDFSGKVEFFSAVTGGAFTCNKTGQFPDSNSGDFGLFTCTYSGVTDIFGTDGVSIAQFTDFGKVYGVWDDFCVLTNRNNTKAAVFNVKNGNKTDWIDAKLLDVFDGKYLVLEKDGKYLLFDILQSSFTFEEQQFMEVAKIGSVTRLNVVGNGYVTVYGEDMKVLLCCRSDVEVAR